MAATAVCAVPPVGALFWPLPFLLRGEQSAPAKEGRCATHDCALWRGKALDLIQALTPLAVAPRIALSLLIIALPALAKARIAKGALRRDRHCFCCRHLWIDAALD